MKPISPHELDEQIAAALHGELTPEERAQFESRLTTDPAAQAAYQEALAMHDLLEKTHQNAQPDPAFEQRMVSGVRRKLQTEQHRETAWESAIFFWKLVTGFFRGKWRVSHYAVASTFAVVVLGLSHAVYHDFGVLHAQGTNGISNPSAAERRLYLPESLYASLYTDSPVKTRDDTADKSITLRGYIDNSYTQQFGGAPASFAGRGSVILDGRTETVSANVPPAQIAVTTTPPAMPAPPADMDMTAVASSPVAAPTTAPTGVDAPAQASDSFTINSVNGALESQLKAKSAQVALNDLKSSQQQEAAEAQEEYVNSSTFAAKKDAATQKLADSSGTAPSGDALGIPPASPAPAPATTTSASVDERKLIRNAQLDLEVKSFQTAMDEIATMTKAAGGYVDTSNSERGGNGKRQGTVVVKVLPQNLDDFLLKLRGLGVVKNQSVSTDDVTKDYFDTQARLDNSRRMETQLQDLLKRENGKVSDLLAVERELGRVRGNIEQMQGQLKLYDFEVQYATVTIQLSEKDLNQAAAYLLKEQDDFSLFATDVEGTFQKARSAADDFKAQVLVANLVHNSGSDVAAELTVMVTPDQIEPFLAQVRSLGRVANFTRQTQRIAKDGGDSDQPADQTLTEKDKVQVHLSIRSDDESRKQVALTVVAKAVDDALDQAKTAALANAGVEILNSSLNKTPQGQSTAQLTLRVPGKEYNALMDSFRALGRTASLSIQRNDNSGPGANGDDAPVIISLALTDDDTPLQETEMSVLADDVDGQAQEIKKDAGAAGVEVKASSFERQPDGTELAQMTFRLPMAKYPAFVESLKKLGKVESLSVRRNDRPDQTVTDDTAPAEISLQLHNQREIVADNSGLWATLRQTFGDGATALFGSVRVIGVVIAFLIPWVLTLVFLAWVGRRIYIWRKK